MKTRLKHFTQNAVLVTLSVAFSLLLARGAVYVLCILLHADANPLHDNELKEKLWIWDSACGYRNRPFAKEKLFGGTKINTESHGFRSDTEIDRKSVV